VSCRCKSFQEHAAHQRHGFAYLEDAASQREQIAIVAFLRKRSERGAECSAEREMLAQQIERGDHLK